VVVPTGALHRLPWCCLPGLRARDVTVAPSAALWSQRPPGAEPVPGGPRPGQVMLVAGPGLPGAKAEVDRLARIYPGALVLTGERATVASVVNGFGHCDLVHLAAHGTFRTDSPLFSSVLLADGPLIVHDLERMPRTAPTVVLASCDGGVNGVELGDELIGTAATLLALGVRSLVAPMVGVPDLPTATFMTDLHGHLARGVAPSAALAAARLGEKSVVALTFLCIGRDNHFDQQ
jgi:CHAT domain-containing protein